MKINRRIALKTSLLTGLGLVFSPKAIAESCHTTSDIEGPFYIPGSPMTTKLSPTGAAGTTLFITGTVYARDCATPIKNALVDLWHANDGGGYENNNYRGIIKTDAAGNYAYETILPGKYLNGAQYRPRHLHYKVSAPDLNANLELTTQIYFDGDTSIPIDPWASDPDAAERIIPLSTDANGAEHGVADIILDVAPPPNGIEQNSGALQSTIKSISPNPASDQGTIAITLNKAGTVSLRILNLHGQEVLSLAKAQRMEAGEHQFSFKAVNNYGLRMAAGIYIVQLWHNGQLQSAKRFVVQ